MNVEQERSRSLWMDIPGLTLGPLTTDLETDVLVIGAGIAGLSTAYELAESGRSVTVVDRGRFGRGMSARTSAHLAYELDDFFKELIDQRGEDTARQYYESQCAAVDRIEAICTLRGIDCDFARVDGYVVAAKREDEDYLRQELESARKAGFRDAQWVAPAASPLGPAAIRFPRQARFHPLKYLDGLVVALREAGARLHDDTAIVELDETAGGIRAKTGSGRVILARAAVVATNTPFHLKIPIHTKQAPYRTYVIAAPVPKGAAPDALIWDTLEPAYHYVRLQPGSSEDLLIVGGEDHKSGEADDMGDRIRRLQVWARDRWPAMGEIRYAWSGQVMEPADYLPFIGQSPGFDNVYLITGDSGEGLATGVAGALILRELVNGRASRWAEAYAPDRKMISSGALEYVKENVDDVRHFAAHLGRGDVGSLHDLAPGQGGLVRIGGKMVAAYRSAEGQVQLHSATCPHAGCIVRWNPFETCWDCPCHGSQFSADGQPLNAPAYTPLAEVSNQSA